MKEAIVNTYSVSREFILEAYNAACSEWKFKIEEQFPNLFTKGDKIIYLTKHFPSQVAEVIYYFSIGDKVQIVDGSYHTTPKGIQINYLGVSQPKGVILYNKCDEILESYFHSVSLNLMIQLEDGGIIFSAPPCVKKIY